MMLKNLGFLFTKLIFLILLSAPINAFAIDNDDYIQRIEAGQFAPYTGVLMLESDFYKYEGIVAERQSCMASLSKLDTLCLGKPQLVPFSEYIKPYILGALTGAGIVWVSRFENDRDKALVIASMIAVNVIFAF